MCIRDRIGTYKASAIVVDSMQTNLSKLASHPIMVKPGTEGLLVKGLVKSVLDQDLVDLDVTGEAPQAFNALKQAADAISLDEVAKQTGISAEQINDIAKIFAEAPRSIILCGEGIVRQKNGYNNVLNLVDLAWITGKLNQAGSGINTVVEEGNEQGALDMGVAPEFLPGPVNFDDAAA